VESPNSHAVVEVGFDEIPLTSSFDSIVFRLLTMELNPFHAIFYLNIVIIATRFDRGSHTIILHPGLKEFLEKCFVQFQVYIWFTTQHHNIYNYLDKIWHKTQISVHVSKVLNHDFYMRNPHFLLDKLDKPIFHKNIDVFFST